MYHIEIYTLKISRFENRGYLHTEIRYKKIRKGTKIKILNAKIMTLIEEFSYMQFGMDSKF